MKATSIVAIFVIAAVPVFAQAQQSSIAQLKEDARNVVNVISSDKAKTKTYCQMVDLSDQADQATEEEKAHELAQKATELGETLGPEYAALLRSLDETDMDQKSQDEIGAILIALDKLCEN
jgi:hypothetical protein